MFVVLIFSTVMPTPLTALEREKLPHAAGQCVNRAQEMIGKGRLSQAIQELEGFRAKGRGVSDKVALDNGYNHYYVDYMLGNTFMMMAQRQDNKRSGKESTRALDLKKKAVRCYEKTLGKKGNIAAVWLNLARCRYDLGRMGAAAEAFAKGYEMSEKEDKKSTHLYYGAVCYFQSNGRNSGKKAIQLFQKLLRRHPGDVTLKWLESYVSMLFALKHNRTALPHIKKLSNRYRGEKRKKWQEILLHQYLHLNMAKSALRYARHLTGAEPLEPKWWKALTHIHLNSNNLEKGLQSLIIYGFLTPLNRDEEMLVADLYLSLNIPSMAVHHYEKVLNNRVKHEKTRQLIHACLASGQSKKALEWIDNLLEQGEEAALLRQKEALLFQREQISSIKQKH